MSVTYVETRQIVSTSPSDMNDMASLKNQLQSEMNNRGLGCIVQDVWKIKSPDQDIIVVETLAPADSPISETLVLAIIGLIALCVIAFVAWQYMSFRERMWNDRMQAFEDLFHDTIAGLGHGSVDEMIQWKQANAPDDFAKYPFWCPFCGVEFDTIDKREAHIKICPDAPVPPPTPPDGGGWHPGHYLEYAIYVVGYRSTSLRQAVTKILRRFE